MLELEIAIGAELDLIEIGGYTEHNWGALQRERYIRAIIDRFEWLQEDPTRGKNREVIKPNYYSYHQGRHEIFYTYSTTKLTILAVLHESMDHQRHLG